MAKIDLGYTYGETAVSPEPKKEKQYPTLRIVGNFPYLDKKGLGKECVGEISFKTKGISEAYEKKGQYEYCLEVHSIEFKDANYKPDSEKNKADRMKALKKDLHNPY